MQAPFIGVQGFAFEGWQRLRRRRDRESDGHGGGNIGEWGSEADPAASGAALNGKGYFNHMTALAMS